MAVSNVPSWIGSSAVNETGERWMTSARVKLRLGAAGWLSELAGRSNEIVVVITSSNHNFYTGDLHAWMLSAAGGSWPASANWKIVVNPGVQLVCRNTSEQVMWFGGGINGKVKIENNGHIFGRGGSNVSRGSGLPGGTAISREAKITLEIVNYGIISGGGGGGGWGDSNNTLAGGGGAPFGLGNGGGNATYDVPGPGARRNSNNWGGRGGYLAEAGIGGHEDGWYNTSGGAAGYAISGGGPIIWTVRGDVRGAVS